MKAKHHNAIFLVSLLLCACERAPKAVALSDKPQTKAQANVKAYALPQSSELDTAAYAAAPVSSTNSGTATIRLDPVRERIALLDALTSNSFTSTLHSELAQLLAFRPSIDLWQSADWARIAACINELRPADQDTLLNLSRAMLSNLEYAKYAGIAQVASQFFALAECVNDKIFAERLVESGSRALWYIERPTEADNIIKQSMERMRKDKSIPPDLYMTALRLRGNVLRDLGEYQESVDMYEELLAKSSSISPEERYDIMYLIARSYTQNNSNPESVNKGIAVLKDIITSADTSLDTKSSAERWLNKVMAR
jgi:tetratricopeptide (TPR) repeat protein